jgi:hypothetical protein
MVSLKTVCLRRLAAGRGREVQFGRFLANERVTKEKLTEGWSTCTKKAVAGKHVLAIQDTMEAKFATAPGHRRGLGKVKKGNARGLLAHTMIAVDAASGACLGGVGGDIWTRRHARRKPHHKRELGDKESKRWAETAEAAKETLAAAAIVTFVEDREGDIYSQWVRVPGEGFHLLVRAAQNRRVAGGGMLFDVPKQFPGGGTRQIELAAKPSLRARAVEVTIRYGRVSLCRPKNLPAQGLPDTVELSFVEVIEPRPPRGAEPVRWLLLTTHEVPDEAAAWQIVDWYLKRWIIEQLHRTLKRQGFRLEDSQVQDAERLIKLTAIAIHAAIKVMQLVQARDGDTDLPADFVFTEDEIGTLDALVLTLQGRTILQKNPHPPRSLAWATWVIARLGGWDGYPSSKKPGPITLLHGLTDFARINVGRSLRDVRMP